MQESNDSNTQSDMDDDNSVFDPLIQEVYEEMQHQHKAKVDSYTAEGMHPTEAEERADEDMLSQYNKALRVKYARWWELLYDLDHNCVQIYFPLGVSDALGQGFENVGVSDALGSRF